MRALWLTVVWAALCGALISAAEEPKDRALSEPASKASIEVLPKGTLSADRTYVATGEMVRLLLRISGEGNPRACTLEQPTLPALAHLELVTVSQRNEVAFRSGTQVFSTTFLYTLRARAPGGERIPAIQVRYKAEGDRESRTIAVEGLEIVVREGRRVSRRAIALIVLVAAGGALLGAAWRLRARKLKRGARGVKAGAPGGSAAGGDEKSRAAVGALAVVEDARGLKVAGAWGEYGAQIFAALSAYLERDSAAEVEELREALGALCERVRYAKDREAERGIEECARKAEIFFKNKIRKQFEQIQHV